MSVWNKEWQGLINGLTYVWKGEEILFLEKHRYSHWTKHCGPAYVITWLYEWNMFGPKAKLIYNQSINEPINQSINQWGELELCLDIASVSFWYIVCKLLY